MDKKDEKRTIKASMEIHSNLYHLSWSLQEQRCTLGVETLLEVLFVIDCVCELLYPVSISSLI